MTAQSTAEAASARRALHEGQYAQALDRVVSALASVPDDDALLLLKVEALYALGRLAETLSLSIQLVTNAPHAATHWHALCQALRGIGYEELALRVNAYALKHVTPTFDLIRFRGDTLFDSNRYDEAISAYVSVLEQFGEQAPAWNIWYNYSSCRYQEGHIADSREADRRALRLLQQLLASGNVTSEKRLAALLFHQGMLYYRLQQWELAEKTFYRSLRSDAQSISAFWLRTTCRREGKWLAAMLLLPWAARNKWLEIRRDGAVLDNKVQQRASIASQTLSDIERIISL